MVAEQLENECGMVEKINWVYTITPIPTKRCQNIGRYCNDPINNITKIERSHSEAFQNKRKLALTPLLLHKIFYETQASMFTLELSLCYWENANGCDILLSHKALTHYNDFHNDFPKKIVVKIVAQYIKLLKKSLQL